MASKVGGIGITNRTYREPFDTLLDSLLEKKYDTLRDSLLEKEYVERGLDDRQVSQVSPSRSFMFTGAPPDDDEDRGREEDYDEYTMYFDKDKEEFVPYPPWLRQTYDWLHEKGYISSLMSFEDFRSDWHKYIMRDKK